MEAHKNIQVIKPATKFGASWLYLLLLAIMPLGLAAQTSDWQYIHQGNKEFKQGKYHTAESFYKKALHDSPQNARALYNLGNVYLALKQDSLALANYNSASNSDRSPLVRAMANHNTGFIYQRQAGETNNDEEKQKKLRAAIDAYKRALRDNPSSESTRYNLVLCQKQLRDSSKNKSNDSKDKQNKDKQKEKSQSSAAPLINYARQAEQQTRKKLNQNNRQHRLEKNW